MKTLKRYKLSILGETYVVVSDEPEERLHATAGYVDDIMRHIASRADLSDTKRIAVLASLQLASQLKEAEEKCALADHKELELAEHIDRELAALNF